MTDRRCLRNHLALAMDAHCSFVEEVGSMVGHVAPERATDAELDALFDAAVDFCHSDALDAAMRLPGRAMRARLNSLWREWLRKRGKAVLESEPRQEDPEVLRKGDLGA